MAKLNQNLISQLESIRKYLPKSMQLIGDGYVLFCKRALEHKVDYAKIGETIRLPDTIGVLIRTDGNLEVYLFTKKFDLFKDLLKKKYNDGEILSLGICKQDAPLWKIIEVIKPGDNFNRLNKTHVLLSATAPEKKSNDYTAMVEKKNARLLKEEEKLNRKRNSKKISKLTDEERSERDAYFNEVSMPIGLGKKR